MAIQNNIDFLSTIEFLSKECKTKNHVNCCKIWIGIGLKVICDCSCHNDNSMTMTDN
jgi:hypothetical protein